MPLRVSEMRMPIDGDERELVGRALRRAGLRRDEVASIELVRKSLDRRRRRPEFVYTFDLHLPEDRAAPRRFPRSRGVRYVEPRPVDPPRPGDRPLPDRPVVVGSGPAGLFAALSLARAGYRPLVVERGSRMNLRVRQIEAFHREAVLLPESNYLFGEGGAGTFSDGKLTCRSKDPRVRIVLDEFRRHSGMDLVNYYYRPHLGSDRVRAVVGRLRREIESLGGAFRYDCRVERVIVQDGRVRGLATSEGALGATCVVLAPGHSARDLYAALLAEGLPLEPKPFQLGFRVEHPQSFVDRSVYGDVGVAEAMGPADYRLAARVEGRSVFSFCMCPGGEIIPAIHDAEHYNTNGMSYFHKDTGFANSGVVTTVEPEEFGAGDPLAGIRFQERTERRAAVASGGRFELPAQRLGDFVAGIPSEDLPATSCRSGRRPVSMDDIAEPWVTRAVREAIARFERQMPGYLSDEAIICGPEARSSAPVRIPRDPEEMVALGAAGLYPVGEGAGYAGGIVSAAVDGWRAAERIAACYAPPAGIS